ncbi:hypothetical protein SKAU_G00164200 [Synaphobranchus kaupii]|uniref:Uncharacterized protein n=1 Tax=Synaphobranchus kaupii TaxID=118154 RepID=A0A9Q1J021_SYNKA|nr:hypothetical protein SKAU_G00164200 [Synaphobranchus kaupii]
MPVHCSDTPAFNKCRHGQRPRPAGPRERLSPQATARLLLYAVKNAQPPEARLPLPRIAICPRAPSGEALSHAAYVEV